MRKLFHPSRRTAVTTAVTLAAATAAVAFVSSAGAASGRANQTRTTPPSCSLATLHGIYLFRGDGTHFEQGAASQAVAYAGYFHFNGAGDIDRGYITARVGHNVQSDRPLNGSTYTLAANCTGSFTINNPAHIPVTFDIFTSPTGSKFTYVQTDNADEQYDADATIAERATIG